MRISSIIAVSLFLLLVSACATSFRVTSDYDRQMPFNTYRTYSLLPLTEQQRSEIGVRDPRLLDFIEQQIRYQLDRRGYREVSAGADLEVGYFVWTRTQTVGREVGGVNVGIGWGGYYGGVGMSSRVGGRIEYTNYVNGTLVVEMYQPDTKGVIWHGAANALLKPGMDNPYKIAERAAAQLFSRYKWSVPKKERG